MAKRKKLSEMTPYERVEQRMEGLSWDAAEDIGVEILARVLSVHIYGRHEGEEYLNKLIDRICDRGDEWAHTEQGSRILAFAALGDKFQKEEQEEN